MEPFEVRQASAHRLSLVLVVLGAAAFVGATVAVVSGGGSFGSGVLFAAHILLVGMTAVAAVLEWRRERLGEAMTIPTLFLAIALTVVDIVYGLWYFAPTLGVATLFAILALVHRYMVRDEQRHPPRAFMPRQ